MSLVKVRTDFVIDAAKRAIADVEAYRELEREKAIQDAMRKRWWQRRARIRCEAEQYIEKQALKTFGTSWLTGYVGQKFAAERLIEACELAVGGVILLSTEDAMLVTAWHADYKKAE